MKNLLWVLFAFATLAHAQGTVTDIDGNTYDYLTYGTQQWTIENAAMETYRDGTPIPQVTGATQWTNLTTGAWCYYDNDPAKGKLYNWYAVAGINDNDPNTPNKEFAPEGWHVPTDAEWTTLEEHLIANGYNYDGTTTGNKILNNSSNFNVLPHGYRNLNGVFYEESYDGIVWSVTVDDPTHSWNRIIYSDQNSVIRNNGYSKSGSSVRFVQNSNTCSEASINASATEVCVGEEVTLNVNNLSTGTTQSCYGSTNQIFADWTELAPNAEYVNIIKHNDIYYLRSNNDVLQSNNINGSWVSMNFQNQIGHQCSPIATLFDFDWADRLHVATLHNSLYAYENGNWINNGLSGGGCSGRALTRLANNRIIVSKWGYLRDLYISDDNGSNWTNVTNVNNDYRDIIVADNGNVFACGGSGTASMRGLIKSTDNGNSFFNVSSELGINYASTLSDDCEGNLYVLADNSIYKSSDEGESWVLFSNTPFNSTVSYSFLLPISSDVLFLFGRNANEIGLYESNNGGATWHELTNPLSDLNTIREIKLVDNVLVILSDEGVFGKTIEISTSTFLWSTGDTSETISVTPTETTEYWVDVTTNGVTCREYVTINVTAPAVPTGDAVQTFCTAATVADLSATGDNIQWYDAATGGNLLDSTTALTDGQMVYASQTVNGCESTERLEVTVSIQDITITASATEVCSGESVDLTVSTGLAPGTTACTSADLPANLQTGLVGYWPFCGNADDESGNGNNGTVNGATLTADRFGNPDSAYSFDGDDDFINIGNNEDLNFNNNFSISCFIYVNSTDSSDNIIINNEGLYEIGLTDLNNTLKYAISNDNPGWSWQNINPIGNNQWYHITLTYNQGEINFYLDGALIYTYQGSGALSDFHPGLDDLRFGGRMLEGIHSFNGSIDNIAMWNLALTGTEVQQLANSSTYTWSTGDTTANISVTPTETTEYWVDVTTNGVTCREFVTINVTAPAAPTGDAVQTFCTAATVADLSATGDNIQWYDAATGGNLLDSTTALTDGQMVYASQTVNGCESTDRLEVNVSIQDINITATATEVCSGESVDLFVDDLASPNHYYYMYVNGYPDTSAATDFPVDQIPVNGPNSEFLTFAGTPGSQNTYNLIGNLDNIMLWSRALNADEVQQVYQNDECNILNLSQSIQTSLIGYWPFCNSNPNGFTLNGQLTSVVDGAQSSSDRNGNSNSAYYFDGNSKITIEGTNNLNSEFNFLENSFTISYWIKSSILPIGDSHIYTVWKQSGHGSNQVGYNLSINPTNNFDHRVGSPSNWGVVNSDFEVETEQWYHVTHVWNGLITANEISYLWSTGDTTPNLTVTPSETTDYWVDVTINGVTCRENVTINITAPAAPTGDSEQTFCNSATVADLTATGDNIQWYDVDTGGNLLGTATALIDGQVLYASQIIQGCESTDRLEVSVSIQNITITASATEVCTGESVDLSVVGDINSTYLWSTGESNFSGQGTLVDEYSLVANTVSQNTFSIIPGNIYRLEVSGTISLGGGAGNQRDVAYFIQSGSDGTIEGTPFDSACNLRIWTSLFCDTPGLRPSPDIYDASTHTYNYPFTANSSTLDVGFWDSPLGDNGSNVVTFKLYELSNSESTITVTPTETTEYWVDVTTNGVTCREYITIDVTAPAAPTGDAEQTFCEASTVADLTATGDNIQWYDAATGGNLLVSTTVLTDGQTVYASQTVNGCESTDRLEVTVSIQDITITASATEVCTGESSTLNVALTNASGTFAEGQLVNEFNHTINTNASQQFPTTVGLNYRLEIEGNVTWGTYCPALAYDPAYVLSGFYGTTEATPRDFACNDAMYSSIFCDSPGLRPIPDQYDGINHSYDYYFTANSNQISVGFFDNLLGDNCGSVTFRLFENSTPPSQNSLVWSTGDTTETISVTPTETTEYWVDVTTNGVTCREYVTITVNDLPEAPTGEIVNYFINCDSFSPTLDDAIATLTGENIKLYDAAVGGNLLDPNSNIIDGQVVYASQTLDSCESSDRLEVQLNLYTLEMPVTAAPNNTVSFCNEQNLTILNLAPAQTATDRLWYETATSTTPIAETTPLVNGVNYYVSNYDIETGCESDRLAMTVEINNPEAPTGDAVQLFCDNVNVSDLSATGSNIQWYDAAIGGNVLDPSSALSDGQLLYASQTENSCESITRLEVSVEIDIIPDPILITTELEFCLAREATLADLEVDEQGFALEWYDSFSGGNMLPMDTLLEDGVSYYATLYDAASGCESLMRLEVVPTVIPCEVVIYNAISLNDNGINDYMVIENAEYFPDNSLEIYNRDGHLLYSQTQYGIGDNLFKGIANVSGIYGSTLSGDGPRLPTGSYLYVFKYFNPYEQQEYTLKGFLTINSN